jgi:anti-anti-sigma regulatory factor
VTVTGELTSEHVAELRALLIKAIINTDRVKVRCEGVTRADLSCLQLLCSAHRSAVRMNKEFLLVDGLEGALKDAAHAAGYVRTVGCRLDRGKSCLWVVGEQRGA